MRRRCAILSLLAVFVAMPCLASGFGHSQSTSFVHVTSATSAQIAVTNNPAQGDVVILTAMDGGATLNSFAVKDCNNNSFTVSTHSPAGNTSDDYIYMAYLIAPANACKTITASWSNSTSATVWLEDFSVTGGTAAYDKDAGLTNGTGSGTTLNGLSITPTGSSELLYAAAGTATGSVSAPTAGSAQGVWTGGGGGLDSSNTGGGTEYDLSASAVTSINFTDSASNDTYSALAVAFTFTASGGASAPPTQMLMGCCDERAGVVAEPQRLRIGPAQARTAVRRFFGEDCKRWG